MNFNQETNKLLLECHDLLNQIAKKTYSNSLLTKVKSFLEMTLKYKSNRNKLN